jgi:hypothetical protein
VQRAQDVLLGLWSYQELGEQEVLDEEDLDELLRDGIVDLLATPNSSVILDDRLTAARVLADLGDPRYPVTLDEWREDIARRNETFGAPNGYWCYIRPGTYLISGWKEGEKSTDIELPDFWIARYPLTVAQYTAFIEDGGYQHEEYWTRQGWIWKQGINRIQPRYWDDTQYKSPNQAVIRVTWYECMAFCAWLSARLADTLPAGYTIQLPTEAEWEAAAAYDGQMQRRTYPWGEEEPTPEHAIFEDAQGNKLGVPTPVGVCFWG